MFPLGALNQSFLGGTSPGAVGALGGGVPSNNNTLGQLSGFGAASALGAVLPAAMQTGAANQGSQAAPSQGGALGSGPADGSQWQQLISMLMAKLGIGVGGANTFGASLTGGANSFGNQNAGFLPSLGVSGIYGR